MILRSFDLETHKTQPGLDAPPIVCGSTADEATEETLDHAAAAARARALLASPEVMIVGANIAYDFGCLAAEDFEILPAIFRAFDDERVFDVLIAQALDAIAGGWMTRDGLLDPRTGGPLRNNGKVTDRYSLGVCLDLTLGRTDAKANDLWRKRYAILERLPMSAWPELALQYIRDDARNTYDVARAQLGLDGRPPLRNLENMPEQVETAFAMHLGAVWGLRTNRERAGILRAKCEALHARTLDAFTRIGFLRADGTEDGGRVKAAVARAYGASGVCGRCGGSGRFREPKAAPCRGAKERGRFKAGCLGAACVTCSGKGTIEVLGNEITCSATAGGCDGTGLDLSTAPTLPRTDKGRVSATRDTLTESGDDVLMSYGDNESAKVLETYLPFIEQGLDRPITLDPDVLKATNRTSYRGLIQLLPRNFEGGDRAYARLVRDYPDQYIAMPRGGVRDCFEARPGYVYCSVDYAALELCTLAQVCLWVVGDSAMARMINDTKDPGSLHTMLAAKMIGEPLDAFKARIKAKDSTAKGYRQAAKAANFGFPGGMGSAKLVLAKRKRSEGTTHAPDGREYDGIRFCILIGGARECGGVGNMITEWKRRTYPPLCRACVEVVEHQLRPEWFETWPEMRPYFEWVSATVEVAGEIPCLSPEGTAQMVRGGVDFCNGSNNGFQHLAARGAKYALRQVVRESYLDRSSDLWGTRPVFFAHDEVFSEMPKARAHLAGPRKARVMVEAMRRYVPDVHVSADPALMRFWYKDAEPAFDSSGKLIPWEPKQS